jgi:hypothetical protein
MLEVVRSTNARTGQSRKSQIMKTLLAVMLVTWCVLTAQGQGTVSFENTSTTQITTNGLPAGVGSISGIGAYRFALYIAPFGNTPSTLLATTTNGPVPGIFDGGNVAVAVPVGTQLSFQVRGWSSFAGNTYEEALVYLLNGGPQFPLLGQSQVGFFTVLASPNPPVILFGTGPGQVPGFTLGVPEPSTYALTGLAVAALVMWRGARRRR